MAPSASQVSVGAAAAAALALAWHLVREQRTARHVERVLRFWFDGPLDQLYSDRWFVPPASAAQRSLDALVRTQFGALLEAAERGGLRSWRASPRGALALIVLLDQFSRHIHRGVRAAIERCDLAALEVCEELLARGWDAALSDAQLVFALMPLRHQPTPSRLELVLSHLSRRSGANDAAARLLERFQRHTHVRLLHLQGEGDPNDILEREDREAQLDQSGAPSEPIARSVEQFLAAHAPRVRLRDAAGQPASRRPRAGQRAARRDAKRRDGMALGAARPREHAAAAADADEGGAARSVMIVSLSGGVDSMVLTHLLLALRGEYDVAAVHIDYSNRPESAAEAEFLRGWCAARGVSLRVRVVTEVSRGVTARDEYEKESRRIRFEAYADAMAATGAQAVFFGHHIGDLQENVISNVMKGAQLLNIAGIAPASTVNGVMIWRPLLAHEKSEIYEYAHKYGVPYFKDSTPAWSTRGKLRNQLMPLLREVYGEGVFVHLSSLARESSQCRDLVQPHLLEPFWRAVRVSSIAVWVDLGPFAHMPAFFWREALRHVCEGMLGTGLIKERPIAVLMERVQRPEAKRRDGWIPLKADNRALVVGTTLVLFRKGAFPGEGRGAGWAGVPHAAEGLSLDGPSSNSPVQYRLGAWRVQLSCTSLTPTAAPASRPSADPHGACPELLWQLVTGQLSYVLPGSTKFLVGSTSEAQAPALRSFRGDCWKLLLQAIPQVVPGGLPTDGSVLIEYTYCDSHFERNSAMTSNSLTMADLPLNGG
ncbi:hypothetical protein AB1Y20_022335 [Prymnesium parvum]|uniref:tRNA(Ile)-lysidine synthetase n=1 Tax=Prymnesium parvum TaxID=97485 RepID=A0AB34JFW9_PRYPA